MEEPSPKARVLRQAEKSKKMATLRPPMEEMFGEMIGG